MFRRIMKKLSLFLINRKFMRGFKFFGLKRSLLRRCGYKIGAKVRIIGPIYISSIRKLEIGDGTFINHDFRFEGNGRLFIGKNCDFAPNVTVLSGGHEIGYDDRRAGLGQVHEIKVGDGCWICANSTLVGTIEVKDGVVLAACSCLKNSTEPDALYAGVPAVKKKNLDPLKIKS